MSFRGVRSEKRWAFAGNLYLKLLLDLEDGGPATGVRDTGQINEALCKVLCHNICVLVQAIHELRIEPNFSAGSQPALKLLG